MTRDMRNQHTTTQGEYCRVRKVTMLKTSEEVKRARIRERQRQRYLTMQQTMLQAIEQAVALPEMPKRETIAVEDNTTLPYSQPTEKQREIPSLMAQAEKVMNSIASWMDRVRNLVLEEG